jgi:PAS domain S-box-containing protein
MKENTFAEAVRVSPYGVLLVDSNGTLKYVNEITITMFQYTEEEMLGNDVKMLVPKWVRENHPNLVKDYFENPVSRQMNQPITGNPFYGERKDGTLFPVEIGLSPILNNCEPCVLAIVQDITLRVEAIEGAKLANQELQKIKKFYDSAPIGFYKTRIDDGTFLMANPTCIKMLGYSNFEEMQSSVKSGDFYPKYERQRLLDAIRENESITDFETQLTLLNGKKIWVQISGQYCPEGDCIEGSITDITDKHKMQEDLEKYKIRGLAELRKIEKEIQMKLEEYNSADCEQPAA